MPADLFLKLGNVKGESVDSKHAGEMELLSARWGMQVAVAVTGGVMAPAGRADLRITFKDVIVSDIDISLGAGDDGDLEVITFAFTEYQEEYKPQNGDGTGGAAVTAGFNCIKCVKL